jgi:acyl-[acyl-carrier-protein] desaturase
MAPAVAHDQLALLDALTPEAERLYQRHDDSAKEWFPHEMVPWSRARDFGPDDPWVPDEVPMADGVRSALFVNLLTEDNLPYYFRTIEALFGADSIWGAWVRRWTAEEGRHSIVIRDYLTATRSIDPVALERARMQQVSTGITPDPPTPADGLVYVALQELATRIAHRNTGKLLDDRLGYEVMARVASDENLHYLFYRDLVTAAMAVDPSTTIKAIDRQVRDFEMPGVGIVGFADHANAIAKAGIYDLQLHHDQILAPVVLRHWAVADASGLDDEAERARDKVMRYIERVERVGRRLAARRQESDLDPVAV